MSLNAKRDPSPPAGRLSPPSKYLRMQRNLMAFVKHSKDSAESDG